jgi:hypothetical protein
MFEAALEVEKLSETIMTSKLEVEEMLIVDEQKSEKAVFETKDLKTEVSKVAFVKPMNMS